MWGFRDLVAVDIGLVRSRHQRRFTCMISEGRDTYIVDSDGKVAGVLASKKLILDETLSARGERSSSSHPQPIRFPVSMCLLDTVWEV